MENRYQQFLKKTLQSGLWELKKNPEATEVAGISLPTFDLLIQAFRSGLSQELKITLPHNLKNPDYLETLLTKLDILLSPGLPEKVTQENLATLSEIVGLYQEHQEKGKIEKDLASQQARWQSRFEQSIKTYHQNLLRNLDKEILKACPSLADKPKIVEIISKDVARTIQDQALPAINFNYEAQKIIQAVTEKALIDYASQVSEIEADRSLASKIAQTVARENEAATWETRTSQINATATTPLWEVERALRLAVARNLPLEIYEQRPEVVEEISRRVLGRLSLPYLATSENYQQELAKEIGVIIGSPEIQKVLGSSSEEARQKIQELPGEVSSRVTPVAQKWSQSPQATMAGVSFAAPPSPQAPPGLPNDPSFRGRFDDAWVASHPTDFLFFGLSQPGLKTLPTSLVGLGLDFLGVFPPLQNKMLLSYLAKNQNELQGAIEYYDRKVAKEKAAKGPNTKGEAAYQNMADYLRAVQAFGKHLPTSITLPIRFYAKIQSLNLKFANKTGIGLFQLLELTAKYGGPGFSYGAEHGLKVLASRLVGASLHASLPGLFLYDELGQEVYFKYGPRGITKWVRGKIFKLGKERIARSAFGAGVKGITTKILAKLGLSALLGTLSGGATILLQIGWSLLKRIWKWLAGALGLFIFWLISQLGGLATLLLAIPGFIAGFMIGGPVAAVVGAISLPTIAVLGKGLFSSLASALFGPGGLISSFSLPSLTGYAILAPVTFAGLGIGTLFVMIPLMSAFVDYQQTFAPIFFSDCRVDDIHQTKTITPENKAVFVAKYMALFPNSFLEKKIDEVIDRSQTLGFNPALAVAIWGEESHFSNYGEKVGTGQVSEGYDFGCGVGCTENRPKTFDQSLGCFVAGPPQTTCKNACLTKPDFASFMECYGPAAQNPNFISNVLSFYRDLVPGGDGAITCPGGTTSEYASSLLNALIACYDHSSVINETSFKDKGACLVSKRITPQAASLIAGSVSTYKALQCVGFAQAVEAATGGSLQQTSYGSAKYYYLRSVPGYQNVPKSQKNVRVGDVAVWNGTDGHMAIVVEVASDMSWFRVAQAIGTDDLGRPYGLVNESSKQLITMPSLLGFLRRQ
ncbi:MAG: CHAP domain-containing protein [Patescibacteria group bacterium]|nr:CHAP domain-containing protein [Patescibacteria group bacterium]